MTLSDEAVVEFAYALWCILRLWCNLHTRCGVLCIRAHMGIGRRAGLGWRRLRGRGTLGQTVLTVTWCVCVCVICSVHTRVAAPRVLTFHGFYL